MMRDAAITQAHDSENACSAAGYFRERSFSQRKPSTVLIFNGLRIVRIGHSPSRRPPHQSIFTAMDCRLALVF